MIGASDAPNRVMDEEKMLKNVILTKCKKPLEGKTAEQFFNALKSADGLLALVYEEDNCAIMVHGVNNSKIAAGILMMFRDEVHQPAKELVLMNLMGESFKGLFKE